MSAENPPAQEDPAEFEALCRQLRLGDKRARVCAALVLRDYGPEALEPLSEACREAKQWEIREAAVRALGYLEDADIVPVLCQTLGDRDERVRLSAAKALEEVGDERAVEPLSVALRSCFPGRSALRQALLAHALSLTTLVGYLAAMPWRGPGVPGLFLTFLIVPHLVGAFHRWRRKRSKLVRTLTLALAQVAERSPTPELRAVLPTLRGIQVDLLQQDWDTRKASRRAVRRIEALTADTHALPVPMRPTRADTFPVPAATAAEPSSRPESAKAVG